jgi:hypothetical protein
MITAAEGQHLQHATAYFSFWSSGYGTGGRGIPTAPYYVYRKDPKFDFSVDYANLDLPGYTSSLFMKKYLVPNATWVQGGAWNIFSNPFAGPAMTKYSQARQGPQVDSYIAKTMTGKESDFEANWAAFQKYNDDAGYQTALAEYTAELKANWDKFTGPVVK